MHIDWSADANRVRIETSSDATLPPVPMILRASARSRCSCSRVSRFRACATTDALGVRREEMGEKTWGARTASSLP